MIIVKINVNRQVTGEHWKQTAIGVTDEYGNPFRIIKLRWNPNRLHKMAEYVKTRGFEDAILSKDPRTPGGIKISYRRPGSIMWLRQMGIGPFMGEVAYTKYNMDKLASHYGDKLWTIMDADIDQQVKVLYEKRVKEMSPELRDYNNRRLRRMHTDSLEHNKDDKGTGPLVPLSVEHVSIEEKNRNLAIREANLDKREAMLDIKNQNVDKKIIGLISAGVDPVNYTPEYLQSQKLFQLRKLCSQLKVKWENEDKRDDLIKKITEKQEGSSKKLKEKVEAVVGTGLTD